MSEPVIAEMPVKVEEPVKVESAATRLWHAICENDHDTIREIGPVPFESDVGERCLCGCPPDSLLDCLSSDGCNLSQFRIRMDTWKLLFDLGVVKSSDATLAYKIGSSLNTSERWVRFRDLLPYFDKEAVRDYRYGDSEDPIIRCIFYMCISCDELVLSVLKYLVEECGCDVNSRCSRSRKTLETGDSLFEMLITNATPGVISYVIDKVTDINYYGGHHGRGYCRPFAWLIHNLGHWLKRVEEGDYKDLTPAELAAEVARTVTDDLKIYEILKAAGYSFEPDPRDKKSRTHKYYINKFNLVARDARLATLLE